MPDIDLVGRLIEQTAVEEILPRFRKLEAGHVREKLPGDLVTIADERTEYRLAHLLTELAPGSVVIGEEAFATDPDLMHQLSNAAPVWVIDPIDGTTNFAEGRPFFAVMVAYIRRDEVLAGWIHDPVGRRTAAAEMGQGAWMAGKRLAVADAPRLAHELSGTLHAGFFGDRRLGRRIQSRRGRVDAVKSLRCAGCEYLRLATGQMHFSLFTKLMPWDHAAGVLLHAEAGGHSGYLEGGPYRPSRTNASGLLLAPDEESWRALRSLLLDP